MASDVARPSEVTSKPGPITSAIRRYPVGKAHEYRRALYKRLLTSAWDFSAWLTHAKNSHWHDAEAAVSSTENAVTLAVSMVIHHIRGVPEARPSCGAHKLTPLRPTDPEDPDAEWERAACTKCDWLGPTTKIAQVIVEPEAPTPSPVESDCYIPQKPLRKLRRPGDSL